MKNREIIRVLNDIDELFKNRREIKKNNPSLQSVPADINLKVMRNKKNLETAYAAYDELRKDTMALIEGINLDNMAALTEEEREKVNNSNKEIAELLETENPVKIEKINEKDIERSNLDIEELAALGFMLSFTSPETHEESEKAEQES